MDAGKLERLLEEVKSGETPITKAVEVLSRLPFTDLGFARVDTHRALRSGFPEVIFCEGKRPEEIAAIAARLLESGGRLLATRAGPDAVAAIRSVAEDSVHHERARAVTVDRERAEPVGRVAILSAGTADMPVAEEARVTAEALGAATDTIYDCGVAGIHRLLRDQEKLSLANALVVVAGMEGALASVVGGLVARPLIAVPTSVGYGASFGGLAPLLTMLNSCVAGVTVVNIDNGFGGGYAAAMINRLVVTAKDRP
jgi:pyridinium-3,5-biscarboxylic acid mononucleotide synthase